MKINQYLGWYKGFVEEFHRYYIYNGERKINMIRSSMQIAKKICEDFARLLMNEKVKISLGNDESNRKLEEILADNNFYVKANQAIEKTFALGMGAFLLSLDDVTNETAGKVKIQFVNAHDIYPLTFDENGISECAFSSRGAKIDASTGKVSKTLNLQVHTLNEQKNYVIRNFEFLEGEGGDLTQTELENIPESIDTGTPNRWFFPIKPNIINNIDLYSPFGIAVFANSIDIIKGLDKSYDSLVTEIQYGRKRLFVTADAMKVGSDGCFKEAFDPNDAVFYVLDKGFNANEGGYVKEDNGQLRVDELTKAIQMNLNLLSMNVGLGADYYSFENNRVTKTATEIISENNTLFDTLKKHEIVLESAIRELVETIGVISGFNTEDFRIDFDDSVIESKEQERLQDERSVSMGVMSKAEFRAKWFGETLEEAEEKIAAIEEKENAAPQINFMDEEA